MSRVRRMSEPEKDSATQVPMGARFMGRGLGELLELKISCRRRLEFLEKNRGRISEFVYRKLSQEYRAYLEAVDDEVSLSLCDYEIKLAEVRLYSNQLELLRRSYAEKLEEVELRHRLGEYDAGQREALSAEHRRRMECFEQSIRSYRGEEAKLREFLDQVTGELIQAVSRPAPPAPQPVPEPLTPPRMQPPTVAPAPLSREPEPPVVPPLEPVLPETGARARAGTGVSAGPGAEVRARAGTGVSAGPGAEVRA